MERERELKRKERMEKGVGSGKRRGRDEARQVERDCSHLLTRPTHLSIVLYSNDIVLCEAGK